jgi:hypothetical protein
MLLASYQEVQKTVGESVKGKHEKKSKTVKISVSILRILHTSW